MKQAQYHTVGSAAKLILCHMGVLITDNSPSSLVLPLTPSSPLTLMNGASESPPSETSSHGSCGKHPHWVLQGQEVHSSCRPTAPQETAASPRGSQHIKPTALMVTETRQGGPPPPPSAEHTPPTQ